jgi:anti-sigma factor RsiW
VANYVRLFAPETFAAAQLSQANRLRTLAALGEKTGLDLSPLAALPGLKFQRAEVLQLKGRPLGQVAYLDEANQIVMVCILVRPKPPAGQTPPAQPLAFKEEAIDDLRIVHWDVQPFGYLVIGRGEYEILRAHARNVVAALGLK